MSGGSYDYLYNKEAGEKIAGIINSAENIVADIRKAQSQNEADVRDEGGKYIGTRPMTEAEHIAVEVTIARFVSFVGKLKDIVGDVDMFDDLLHDVEWYASCDYGPADVVDSCVKHVETALGVKLKRRQMKPDKGESK